MTVTLASLGLYAGALLILFLTPGPVWVALTARALSGGFAEAWPLAVGVALGDLLWPLLAILGMTWVADHAAGVLEGFRWVAAAIFLWMGWTLIRSAGRVLSADSRLMRPGRWSGFAAGVAVILGNPKAILFYLGILPGFFDLTAITWPDVAVILALSAAIPMLGNLALAAMLGRVRRLLSSPAALARVNRGAGMLLILVGLAIPFV